MSAVMSAYPKLPPAVEVPALLPNRNLDWPISWVGVSFIADREKCRLRSYKPVDTDPWTCGWGETSGVTEGMIWTQEYADKRFCDSLSLYTDKVKESLKREANANQLAAMVCLAYNIGLGWNPNKPKPNGAKDGFRQSSVLKRHNEGKIIEAAESFGMWDKAGGKVLKGLVLRRAAEKTLYLTPVEGSDQHILPQTVDAETKLTSSPIAQASTATIGAGGFMAALGPLGEHVSSVKTVANDVKDIFTNTFHIPDGWFLPVILVTLGGVSLTYRFIQRRSGRA